MSRDPAYLLDILIAARLLQEYTNGISRQALEADPMRQDAIIRRIEIIGEATRRLSHEFRDAHPEIPWQDMAGMRSRLIHDYDEVNLSIVWDVVMNDIPALITLITPLVPPEDTEESE